MAVIPLQVVANMAHVAIDKSGPYANDCATWKLLFLLLDVVCCCTVLFPIFWSIKNLQEAAVNRLKLTFFRQYCIVVICYIYITRVVVYALLAITSYYRYMWNSMLTGELATLTFYIFIGYEFRPEKYNPYFAINEEAATEALELHGNFKL